MPGIILNDRYRLDESLGRGAMGAVYRGYDTLLQREVAVKVLDHSGIGTQGRARLLREAQATAQLNHPNIAAVYDAGEAILPPASDPVPYIVMEFVRGHSLGKQRPETPEQIILIAEQVCAALEHAHTHGVIHRDLKPENIVCDGTANVKLIDFGLARASIGLRISQEGAIVGTVAYLAPEQARGGEIDGRADLYSLGIILYELATGQLPFNGDDPVAIISQHLYAPVVPPRTYNPAIPSALENIILRLLNKQPEDRFASASEVSQALAAIDLAAPEDDELCPEGLACVVRGQLVGREHELAEMSAAWQRAFASEGNVLLISGEPGIGKTRLVRELTARAAIQGGQVLSTECYAEAGLMPYAPLRQLFVDTIGEPRSPSLQLPEYVIADLANLAPELRVRFPNIEALLQSGMRDEQQRFYESTVAWISALASHTPTLLFIDDVHWAEAGTLALLRHIARRTRKSRLLIVMTYREIELDESEPLLTMLHDLNREHLATRLKLTRLDRDQTEQMLQSMLFPHGTLDAQLVEVIFKETEGNPFYIEEVCKALAEDEKLYLKDGVWTADHADEIDIPQSIRVAIQARLARLPEASQEALRMAAILGREFDFETLLIASEMEENRLVNALETAEQAQIISETTHGGRAPTSFIFVHALVPSTLRESISGLRRQRMHRSVAQALTRTHPDDFETLAYHYEKAGDTELAQAAYTKAADRAISLNAYQQAEGYYRLALELSDDDDEQAHQHSGLGEALFRQARYAEAEQAWREAIQHNLSINNVDEAARLYARCARAAWYDSKAARGLEICLEGMQIVPAGMENPGIAALLHETARAYRFNNQHDEALPLCQKALAMAEKLELIDVQADALATLGILLYQPAEARRSALTRAIALAKTSGRRAILARALLNYGGFLQDVDEYAAAYDAFYQAYQVAREMGFTAWEHDFLMNVAEAAMDLGRLEETAKLLETIKELEQSLESTNKNFCYTVMLAAHLQRNRGFLEEAAQAIQECIANHVPTPDASLLPMARANLADILLDLGRYKEAEDLLEKDVARGIPDKSPVERVWQFALLSIVQSCQGKVDEARQSLTLAGEVKGADSFDRSKAIIMLAGAYLDIARHQAVKAIPAFEQILRYTQRVGLKMNQAKILRSFANFLNTNPEVEDKARAMTLYQDALNIYKDIGAPGYVSQLETLLKGQG